MHFMRKYLLPAAALLFFVNVFAQSSLTRPADGGNKPAMVGERIGLTDVTIHYNRPGVKGREGKIWGDLIHTGFSDLGFGSSRSAPWRAGANENTTIEFSTDVMIEGKSLPAGKYGFFIAYDQSEPTLIFSKDANAWGSFFYDEKQDALRVKVKPQSLDRSVEWMKFEFMNETENSAVIALQWEKLSIPFKVETDLEKTQLEVFREELKTDKGFNWQAWDAAAQWSLQHNVNLQQALQWADTASGRTFGGNNFFRPQATKAQILAKLGRGKEADDVMKAALPLANMQDLHLYGRTLLQQKKNKEAVEIFRMNYKKYPGEFTTMMGMTRGLSANGEYKEALKYAKLALAVAPNQQNKTFVEQAIKKLEEGKDIN
jgi:tetratricopeptide (TPR) repeat protein